MKKNLLILLLLFNSVVPILAQQRDKQLHIEVTTDVSEDLSGQAIQLMQTDYSLDYGSLTLNSEGKCDVKVYSGNHHLSVSRVCFTTAESDFNISETCQDTTVTLKLTEVSRTPYALTATVNHNVFNGDNTVTLTWNQEPPVFSDDFESYDAFATSFGDWEGIDGDQLPAAGLQGSYPNRGALQYAQIINPLTVSPAWWYSYPVLRPYEGKQYVGFTRTASGSANDDWLITPQMTLGTDNVFQFMAKAGDVYDERFMVYITEKIDSPTQDDFQRIDLGNYESVDYKAWKKFSYDLSAYEGKTVRLAIRYIGDANTNGAFMLMIDNVYVGQAQSSNAKIAQRVIRKSADNPNETFDIFQNGAQIANTDQYTYTTGLLADGAYTFGVQACYKVAKSEVAEVSVNISANDYAKLQIEVSTNSKLTADGQQINLTNSETGESYTLTVADGEALISSLPKGTYLLNVAAGAFNAYNETVVVDADKDLSISLTDRIIDPYNITADLQQEEDSSFTAILKWNQELAFTDSFEDYDDFATGSFGGWTSIDCDQKSVYPISLQGTVVSFPGSSEVNAPKALAPIVFNPLTTTPPMYPTDAAIKAPTDDKFIAFFSPMQAQADKWLISPEFTVREGFEMSVVAKSYTTQYPESFEFCVSTDGADPENFHTVSTATNMPGDQWTQYTTSLKDYENQKVRIGIHYVSYDTFFAQMDDFRVGPAEGETVYNDYGNVDHYVIYLDGTEVGTSETSTYELTDIPEGTHVIGIQAIYKNGASAIVNYEITVTGISKVNLEPAAAETIYNLNGQQMNGDFNQLPSGIYVIKKGNKVFKIRK